MQRNKGTELKTGAEAQRHREKRQDENAFVSGDIKMEGKEKKCENCVRVSQCYPAEYGGVRWYNTKLMAEICGLPEVTKQIEKVE